MKFIYSIMFTILTTAYVIFRNRFVPTSSQSEYFFVAGMIAGMFIAGLVFDIIQKRFLERFKINKSVFIFSVVFLFLAVLFYWAEDLLEVADAADYVQIVLHFGGGILGFIVAAILAPLLFKSNLVIGTIFFILGMWAQWGLDYFVFFTYPLSIIMFLALGLYLRHKVKLEQVQ